MSLIIKRILLRNFIYKLSTSVENNKQQTFIKIKLTVTLITYEYLHENVLYLTILTITTL